MKREDSTVIRGAFSDRLSDLIKDSGKKIDELAKEIGISTGILSTYQNDGAEAGITKLKKIADYFGVSCDYLLGGAECKVLDNEAVRRRTGLSDGAILALEIRYAQDNEAIVILNHLLENYSMDTFVSAVMAKINSGIKVVFIKGKAVVLYDDKPIPAGYKKSDFEFLNKDAETDNEGYQEYIRIKELNQLIIDTAAKLRAQLRHNEEQVRQIYNRPIEAFTETE